MAEKRVRNIAAIYISVATARPFSNILTICFMGPIKNMVLHHKHCDRSAIMTQPIDFHDTQICGHQVVNSNRPQCWRECLQKQPTCRSSGCLTECRGQQIAWGSKRKLMPAITPALFKYSLAGKSLGPSWPAVYQCSRSSSQKKEILTGEQTHHHTKQ